MKNKWSLIWIAGQSWKWRVLFGRLQIRLPEEVVDLGAVNAGSDCVTVVRSYIEETIKRD